MIAASRSLTVAGTAALLGAGLIATSAVTPAHVATPRLSDVAVQLQASVLDIFTFPALRQAVANEVEFVAIQAVGLAESGTGLAQSFAALPETLITVVQQTFAGDLLGALTTLEQAGIAAAEATLLPLITSQIEVGQIQLAIQSALLPAQPIALVQLGAGLFDGFDAVARAFIIAGQNFVDAVLSFNIANIVNSVVDGVTGIASAFRTGGQDAVDGIVAAQTTLATALAARPTPIVEEMAATPAAAIAPVQPVSAPAAAAAVAETPAAVDPVDTASEAADAGAPAADPAPHRTSVRAAARATVADAADADDTATPKKPAAKRAARAGSAN